MEFHQKDWLEAPPWKKLDKKALEKEYSPSQWSKRYSSGDEVIEAHIGLTERVSDEVRRKIPKRLDVPYGLRKRAKLDVFGEDLPKESYIVAYVHGGYWQALHKDVSLYPVEQLYKSGIVCVIVGYTLAPEASFSEITTEVEESVRWTCELARERGSKGVALVGWSAGGHLIAETLSRTETKEENQKEKENKKEEEGENKEEKKEEETRGTSDWSMIRGLVTLAGVFDVRPLVFTPDNAALNLDEQSAWEVSPMWKVGHLARNTKGLKALMVVGEHDSTEFKRQSKQYCENLKLNNIEATYQEVLGADHFNLVEDLSLPNYSLTLTIQKFVHGLNK